MNDARFESDDPVRLDVIVGMALVGWLVVFGTAGVVVMIARAFVP